MTSDKAEIRRRYSRDFKAQVMAQCDVPWASVAKVAMPHGISTNVIHRRRKLAREAARASVPEQQAFIPMRLAQPAERATPERDIEVQLHPGALMMKITWPSSMSALTVVKSGSADAYVPAEGYGGPRSGSTSAACRSANGSDLKKSTTGNGTPTSPTTDLADSMNALRESRTASVN
jgi:transposase